MTRHFTLPAHAAFILFCFAFGLLSSKVAAAQDSPNNTGPELTLRPGYGSADSGSPVVFRRAPLLIGDPDVGQILNEQASPYGSGFVGDLSLGYRVHSLASLGLYGQLRSSGAEAPNDGTEDLSRSAWGAGFYGRVYLPMLHEKLDPYFQFGVGYVQDTQTFKRPVQVTTSSGPMTLQGEWEITHHGVAVPLGLGVGYRVLPMLSVGPSFRYDLVFAAGGCHQVKVPSDSRKYCADEEDNKRLAETKRYGVWSAGLDLKLTL